MKDFIFLKFLDMFKWVFAKDVDYVALRKIIQLKIVLDSRTSSNISLSAFGNNRSLISKLLGKRKKERNRNTTTIVLYFIIGVFASTVIGIPSQYMSVTTLVGLLITGFMIFMGMRIISVFSTVLINTDDSKILGFRPVNKKTVSTARAIYCIYYIGIMSLALIIVPIIAISLKYSVMAGGILLLDAIFADMLFVAFVALLYYFILKFFDGEKLKDVITAIQVILAIIIFAASHAFYVIQPIEERLNDMSFHIWFMFTPTYWFVAPFGLIYNGYSTEYLVATLIGVIIPIVAIAIYISRISKFEVYLGKLDKVSKSKKKVKFSLMSSIGNLVCTNKEEKAFFNFSNNIMKNEREFKQKAYPQLARGLLSPAFLIIVFAQGHSMASLRNGYWFLVLYLGAASVASFVYLLKYSTGYKGAWVYHITPLENEGVAYTGALKAFFVRIVLPLLIIFAIVMVGFWGINRIPEAITLIFATALSFPISYKLTTAVLPFSLPFVERGRGNRGRGMWTTIIMVIIAIIQFLYDYFIPYGNYIFMVIVIVVCIFTWKKLFKK